MTVKISVAPFCHLAGLTSFLDSVLVLCVQNSNAEKKKSLSGSGKDALTKVVGTSHTSESGKLDQLCPPILCVCHFDGTVTLGGKKADI